MRGAAPAMMAPLMLAIGLAPVAPATAEAWRIWTDRARSIALAEEFRASDDGEEPEGLKRACAQARRPLPGHAKLPTWTEALAPYCTAVIHLQSLGEPPVTVWRAFCRDGRRAAALLAQARPVALAPRAEPVARRLLARWRSEYAASCPAIIPPRD